MLARSYADSSVNHTACDHTISSSAWTHGQRKWRNQLCICAACKLRRKWNSSLHCLIVSTSSRQPYSLGQQVTWHRGSGCPRSLGSQRTHISTIHWSLSLYQVKHWSVRMVTPRFSVDIDALKESGVSSGLENLRRLSSRGGSVHCAQVWAESNNEVDCPRVVLKNFSMCIVGSSAV